MYSKWEQLLNMLINEYEYMMNGHNICQPASV